MSARSPNSIRPSRWAILCCALVILGLATPALADSIYLKNGRVIRTERVRVEGDWVIFEQYGSEVRIPASLVDRIEKDGTEGPEPTPTPLPGEISESEDDAAAAEDAADAAEDGESGDEGEDEPPPEETRAYWQEQVRSILEERAELEERLQELRREERAFLFSHRSTADTRRQIEEVQERQRELDEEMQELHRRARREGIPPGWLRLDPSERPGGDGG